MKTSERTTIPIELIWVGQRVTSPIKIARIMNKYYRNKVNQIREEFKKSPVDPIEMLEKCIEKPKSTFSMPLITREQCFDIIMKMKKSNAAVMDNISSK